MKRTLIKIFSIALAFTLIIYGFSSITTFKANENIANRVEYWGLGEPVVNSNFYTGEVYQTYIPSARYQNSANIYTYIYSPTTNINEFSKTYEYTGGSTPPTNLTFNDLEPFSLLTNKYYQYYTNFVDIYVAYASSGNRSRIVKMTTPSVIGAGDDFGKLRSGLLSFTTSNNNPRIWLTLTYEINATDTDELDTNTGLNVLPYGALLQDMSIIVLPKVYGSDRFYGTITTDYQEGYLKGKDDAQSKLTQAERDAIYNSAYQVGLNDNSQKMSILSFIPSIFGSVVAFIVTIGKFEIWGISLGVIIGILVLIGIGGFILKLIFGGK
jgi:hypothetical protein